MSALIAVKTKDMAVIYVMRDLKVMPIERGMP
jgi:hypothetical protein